MTYCFTFTVKIFFTDTSTHIYTTTFPRSSKAWFPFSRNCRKHMKVTDVIEY